MSLGIIFFLIWRGLRLRCPRCGVGKVFRHGFVLNSRCSACGWVYEREEGYWTGAMALNLIIAEGIEVLALIPILIWTLQNNIPIVPVAILGTLGTFALPFIFYRVSRSLWMSIDFIFHPVPLYFPRSPHAPDHPA